MRLNQSERYTATMICDSVSSEDYRLSSIHVTMPRIILAEFNTHRKLTRNSRSTRAVPTSKLIEEVRTNPYRPLRWLKNKPGMQASEPMEDDEILASEAWMEGARYAADTAEILFDQGLHKQWAGRVLEPYLFTDVLVSSTDWTNFMALRDHGDAQPEIELVAQRIRDCLDGSTPKKLYPGEWHLPYVRDEDWELILAEYVKNTGVTDAPANDAIEYARQVSASRCARVSYKPFDGAGTIEAELDRFDKLATSLPVHSSPMEHQATPDNRLFPNVMSSWVHPDEHRNFDGWRQHRALIKGETVTEMPARRH